MSSDNVINLESINTSWSATDWGEKVSACASYLSELKNLCELITEQATPEHVIAKLDVCRIARSVLYTPFRRNKIDTVSITVPRHDESSAKTKLYQYLRQSVDFEKLIIEWLDKEYDSIFPKKVSEFELDFQLKIDPRYDLLVVMAPNEYEIVSYYKKRGFDRCVAWVDISQQTDPASICELKLREVFKAFGDFEMCRPREIWVMESDEDKSKEKSYCAKLQLEKALQTFFISENTRNKFSGLWVRNTYQNIASIARLGREAASFADQFIGSSAVVFGAGPTLNDAIEWYRRQSPRPTAIAAFKALRALQDNGIDPEIVVLLDPAQGVRHLDSSAVNRVGCFFAEISANPEVIKSITSPIIPYVAGLPTLRLADELGFPDLPVLTTGGSVIHAALQVATKMGFAEVALAGVDLGFPGGRLYADGAGKGDKFVIDPDTMTYYRSPLDAEAKSGIILEIEANNGSYIPTTLEMLEYKKWIEQFICAVKLERPGFKCVNLSSSGARIEGVPFESNYRITGGPSDIISVINKSDSLIASDAIQKETRSKIQDQLDALRRLDDLINKYREAVRGPESIKQLLMSLSEVAAKFTALNLILSGYLSVFDDEMNRGKKSINSCLEDLCAQIGHASHNFQNILRATLDSSSNK